MTASWDDVDIRCAPAWNLPPGTVAESPRETADSIRAQMKGHFPEGPAAAAAAHASWHGWLVGASLDLASGGPVKDIPEPAYQWLLFTKRRQEMREFKEKELGRVECRFDPARDVDFLGEPKQAKILERRFKDKGRDR